MTSGADCELCEAAPLTERYYEDDECWIAECEGCFVPMVVWRRHDPDPTDDVKARLHARLDAIIAEQFEGEHYIDDNMRTIPTHYHAHARPRHRFAGGTLRRRTP